MKHSLTFQFHELPGWLILLFVFTFPFSTHIASFFSMALLVVFLLSGEWEAKWEAFKASRVLHLCVALFAWTVFAGVYAEANPDFLMKALFKYKKLLLAIPVFFFLNAGLKSKMLMAYVAAEFFSIALSLYKGHGLVHFFRTGEFKYSENFRIYIVEGMHIALVLFILLKYFVERQHQRWMLGGLIVILMTHSVFLNGRMALLSFLISVTYFIFWRLKTFAHQSAALTGLALAALLAYQSMPLIEKRVDRTIAEASEAFMPETPTSIRLQFFHISWSLFKASPVIGMGPGAFHTVTSSLPDKDGEFVNLLHTHNEYLTLLSQYGLIGLSLFLLLIFFSLKEARHSPLSPYKHVAYLGMVLFLVNSLTDSMLYMEGFFFVFLLACAFTPKHARAP